MATLRQKKLAEAIVENAKTGNKKNKKDLLVSVGYATSVAEVKPQEILEQKGVREELAKLGFTTENAKAVVAEILLDKRYKAADRLNAAGKVFEVQGDYAPEKHLVITKKIIRLDA